MIRIGADGSEGIGGQHLPFSRAVQAGGWLYVSGQTPMINAEVVEGSISDQSLIAISNCLEIAKEAGYGTEHVVHVTVILTDARYFQSFNQVFKEVFGKNPPARICSVSDLVVDCKVEVGMVCFKESAET